MKNLKKWISVLCVGIALAMAVVCCSACSTTAFSNLKSYFEHVGEILGGNETPQKGGENTVTKTKLATPTNLKVENDEYSFTGVEHADAYLLYFYDAAADGEDDDYLYTGMISVNESGSAYSGKIAAMFTYGYGSYTVKLVAYANKTSEYLDSDAASCNYLVKGALNAPQIEYLWDGEGSMSFQLKNSTDYAKQIAPDAVELTITDKTDTSKSTSASFDRPNTSSSRVYIDVELIAGHAYTVSAIAKSASEFVTSATSEAYTFEIDALPAEEVKTDGYDKQGGGGFNLNISKFTIDPTAASFKLDTGMMNIQFTCTLLETPNEGSSYSYKVTDGVGINGTLELKTDGKAILTASGGPLQGKPVSSSWTLDETSGIITVEKMK